MTDENEIKWTAGSNPAFRSDANSSPTPGARHARVLAPHSRSRAGRTSSRNGRACPVTPFLLNTGARALRPAATVDSPVRATLSTAGARAGDVDSGRVGESQSRARTTFYLTWPETSDAQHGRDGEGGSGHVVPTCSTESERSGWAGQPIPFHGLLDSPASPRAPLAHAGAPVEPLLPQRVLPLEPSRGALLPAVSDRAAGPSSAFRAIQAGLATIGWDLRSAEIDVGAGTARIELRRAALMVTFDARNGSASTTRENAEVETEAIGRRGDRFLAERIHMRFLGRDRHTGLRSGLRSLANYVADNAVGGGDRIETRNIFRVLLSEGADTQ